MVLAIVVTLLHFSSAMAQPENETKMAAAQSGTGDRGMSNADLRKRLTAEQYHVTMQCGTEPPFKNAYWDNTRPGSMWTSLAVSRSSVRWISQ